MRELLEAGAHFGHQTRRWNPKMGRFIFGKSNGIHILDLQKTQEAFNDAADYVYELGRQGGNLLFVGTKRQAQSVVIEEAQACGQYFVSHRWLGGMLTNFVTIRKSVDKLHEIEARLEDPEAQLTKKERVREGRQQMSMSRSLDGIRKMDSIPDAIFVVDPRKEHIAVAEAHKLGVTVLGIVDTNCNPDEIDYPIPANDDAIRSIRLITRRLREAYQAGATEAGRLNGVDAEEAQVQAAQAEEVAAAPETPEAVAPEAVAPEAVTPEAVAGEATVAAAEAEPVVEAAASEAVAEDAN